MAVIIVNIDLSKEIFLVDMSRALKSSLKHRHKHVLRPLQLYGDQALEPAILRAESLLITDVGSSPSSLDIAIFICFTRGVRGTPLV